MRILILGLNFSPELTGIGKYTGEMAQYLAERNHSVQVITAPPYYPYWHVQAPYHAWHYQRETWNDIEVYRCPLWVPRKPSGLTRLLHLFSFLATSFPVVLGQGKWKPEIILTIAPSLFSAFPALTLSKMSGAKTWLHIQDFELDAALGLGLLQGGKRATEVARKMETNLLQRFDRVSTISNRMLERLWQKGVVKERTSLFPNWVDTDLIYPLRQPSRLRKEWEIGDEQVVVLYSGNLGRKQGLEILITVARSLVDAPEILFILCGDGAMREQLLEESRGLPNIRFFPLQASPLLNELLNLADIHILPQSSDAADLVMPSKLSGMLASGKAVVATALKESELGMIVNKVGSLVPPEQPESLSGVLRVLAVDIERRRALGTSGREWVVKHWSKTLLLNSFEEQLQAVIKSISEQSSP